MREWALVLMLVRAAPLAWGALAFGGGLLLSEHFSAPWPIMAGFAIALAAAAGAAIHARREALSWLFALLSIAALAAGYLGACRSSPGLNSIADLDKPLGGTVVEGTIVNTPATASEYPVTIFELSPDRLIPAGHEAVIPRGRIRVTLNWRALDLKYGDVLSLSGTFRVPGPPTNPGQSDSRKRYRAAHIIGGLSCWKPEEVRILGRGRGNYFKRVLESIRRRAVEQVVRLVGPPQGNLLASMLFGARMGLTPDVLDAFRDTGLMHVLVTSGLHVGLLAWMSLGIFGRLGVSRQRAAILTLPVLAGYLAICGGEPPLLRSTLMFSLLVAGEGLGRSRSAVNSLGMAALIILLIDPEGLWDPSFNFSFAATFGILSLAPWIISRRGALPLPFIQVAACTFSAQLALLPLLAENFQKASFLGTIANLAIIPAMSLFLGMGFALLAAGWIPGIGALLGQLTAWLLQGVEGLVNFFAGLPLASIIVPAFSSAALVAYCAWLLGFLAWQAATPAGRGVASWWPRLFCLGGASGLVFLVWRAALAPAPGDLSATFLDVGHGLAVVIRLPSGRALLFDAGSAYAGHRVVSPFLKSAGVGRIAAVVLSHPHSDHLGGLIPVFRQLPADSIYFAGERPGESPESARLERILLERGVVCRQVRAGDEIAGEPGVQIRFLYPPNQAPADTSGRPRIQKNDPAVLAVSYRDSSLLLAGDINSRMERALVSIMPRLSPDLLLQVPHHGSVEASCRAFLAAVRPRHAVISAGKFRRSPHPHPATVIRLREQGARIWSTARSGAITAVAGDNGWSLSSAMP